ncbi:NAD(P)/FAD-dependent oxidoreductase [Pontiella agarivorans]|uniref:FAD-dependent oxidoreductase n=1 Tax=Pontiella agarivorans TaxID=3038953 RepID=A0ABU5MZB4_9BACT|nr:FAD-dependent oxidoreductase [Pontiella agarivorans]MDZ8119306.1 FAD-dependent oxidoreductase [Pontiella agarivorans]
MNNGVKKIAVIGSGVAGLTAAHILQRKHRVTLIEEKNRLGGHTNTVTISGGPDAGTPIDTGFIVMNHRNYPLFSKLLAKLDVELRDSDMTFGYYDRPSGLQYCGTGLNGLFAQRRNLVSPMFLRMVKDTLRFFKTAEADRTHPALADETFGDYLNRNGFGQAFIDHHIIPMGSAIWSTPCEEMLQFPAQSFLQFFHNHGLLTLNDRPQWRTVVGGSSSYIDKMKQEWNQVEIRTGTNISGIRRDHGVQIFFGGIEAESFDEVIIATHADDAIKLLRDPSAEEQALLGCWQYTVSRTLLHTDPSVMPPLRNVWSSWNFQRLENQRTCLTYDMNRLQGLETENPYFVSLNLPEEPQGIIAEFNYTHPMYTRDALKSRNALKALNGSNHTWFAGSYMGNGFHEDAVRSAVEIANAMGMEL